jgi:hypothetical protein
MKDDVAVKTPGMCTIHYKCGKVYSGHIGCPLRPVSVPPSHLTINWSIEVCQSTALASTIISCLTTHCGQENKVQDPVLEEMNGGAAPPKHEQGRCVTLEYSSEPSYALQEGKEEEVALLHEERVLH